VTTFIPFFSFDKGHVVPEARLGGPIALVKNGDKIIVDSENRTINWIVSSEEQAHRKKEWDASNNGKLTVKSGVLLRYARDVAVSSCPSFSIKLNNHHLWNWAARQCWSVLRLKGISMGVDGVCIMYLWNKRREYISRSLSCAVKVEKQDCFPFPSSVTAIFGVGTIPHHKTTFRSSVEFDCILQDIQRRWRQVRAKLTIPYSTTISISN